MQSGAFRTDIEGLRAISIIGVVLYHAKIGGFAGGFVGVDIFFVISGFLICRLLFAELISTNRIDLAAFWTRRARRLLPNATLTLLAVLFVGAFLTPSFLRETVARDVVSAALYFANYHFASKSVDYFRHEDPLSPVMHFWSLSIEEQFYIVWPVALLAIAVLAKKNKFGVWAVVLGLVWTSSFLFSVFIVTENQPVAFFHTGARVWQLATGGLIALGTFVPWRFSRRVASLVACAGIAAIASSIAAFSDSILYPGLWALAPTLGAASVVVSGVGQPSEIWPLRILGNPFFRWIGARSYSWYLWHWPVIVFAQQLAASEQMAAAMSVPISLAIASLVYAMLEDPVRRGALWNCPQRTSLVGAGAAIGITVAASAVFTGSQFRSTASQVLVAQLKTASSDHGRNYADNCHLPYDVVTQPSCLYGDAAGQRRAVLFGDSHAAQWFAPLDAAARAARWKFQSWTKSSCPSVDIAVWYPPRKAAFTACDAWRSETVRALVRLPPDVLFISNLTDYSGWILDKSNNAVLFNENARAVWRDGFRRLLALLVTSGLRVVVIRDTPTAYKSFAACIGTGGGTICDRPRDQALDPKSPDIEIAREFGSAVEILDLSDRICDFDTCPASRKDKVLYLDRHHLTASFTATMSDTFAELLARIDHEALSK